MATSEDGTGRGKGERGREKGEGTQEGFEFDLQAPMVQISDGELLDGLRRFAAVRGRSGAAGGGAFRIKQFNAWRERPFAANTVIKRFGSWRTALAMIGIEDGRGREYDAEELVRNLEDVWRELGRRPGARYLARRGKFSAGVYRRRWGCVRNACQYLARYHRGEITREELLRGEMGRARRRGVPLDVRWRVIKRDGYRCVACGKSPANDRSVELQVDHVVAVSRGGSDDESNLRTLCGACNVGRSNEDE